MKVIEAGKPWFPENEVWWVGMRGKCPKCLTVIELEAGDWAYRDNRARSMVGVECPICGENFWKYRDDREFAECISGKKN